MKLEIVRDWLLCLFLSFNVDNFMYILDSDEREMNVTEHLIKAYALLYEVCVCVLVSMLFFERKKTNKSAEN